MPKVSLVVVSMLHFQKNFFIFHQALLILTVFEIEIHQHYHRTDWVLSNSAMSKTSSNLFLVATKTWTRKMLKYFGQNSSWISELQQIDLLKHWKFVLTISCEFVDTDLCVNIFTEHTRMALGFFLTQNCIFVFLMVPRCCMAVKLFYKIMQFNFWFLFFFCSLVLLIFNFYF